MTISTHAYTAELIGTPDVPLSVIGGRLSLDEGSSPHVSGALDIAQPSEAVMLALDPRDNVRIRVTASAVFPTGAQSRVFDLGLRERPVAHGDARVTLTLASDEALLSDYAQPADDFTPFTLQSSIRNVVNYVLGKAIPGASLEPGVDMSVQTYATVTNLITDPSNEGTGAIFAGRNSTLDKNDTSWAAQGTKSINIYSPTSNDSNISVGPQASGVRAFNVQAGRTYLFSATGRVKMAVGGSANTYARRLTVSDQYGVIASSPALPTTVGTATRVSVVVTLPERDTFYFRAWHGHTSGEVQWDAFRLTEYTGDPTDVGFFSGATPDTAGYDYKWDGPTNDSTSTRTALIERDPRSLIWPVGIDALSFLRPIVQALGLRLVCDEARDWTLRDENYSAGGDTLAAIYGVNLVDGSDTISRDSGLWFDAQATVYTDPMNPSNVVVDYYEENTPPNKVNRVEVAAAYPGPGRSEYAVRRAQGRGIETTVTLVANWDTMAEQPITVTLPSYPLQVGEVSRVEFDLDADEMTITTRGVEVPAGAIDLLSGTIDALVGTIDAL